MKPPCSLPPPLQRRGVPVGLKRADDECLFHVFGLRPIACFANSDLRFPRRGVPVGLKERVK